METLHYRSGAVARMVGMPVTTLRVWERRYGVGSAGVAPSGHRLYSAADVERIALLKRLTQLGHAIGSIAPLGTAELRRVGTTHAEARALADESGSVVGSTAAARRGATGRSTAPRAAPPARVVVVGAALGQRLQRLARADGRWRVVAVFADLAEAARAGSRRAGLDERGERAERTRRDQRAGGDKVPSRSGRVAAGHADVLLVDLPALPAQMPRELTAARRAWSGAQAGLVYGFGAEAAHAAHAAAGWALLRDPRDDEALDRWVETLGHRPAAASRTGPRAPAGSTRQGAAKAMSPDELAREAAALAFTLPFGAMDLAAATADGSTRGEQVGAGNAQRGKRAVRSGAARTATSVAPVIRVIPGTLPPRRFDDLTLVELAARSPAMACECPRHVAELLKQLSHFEAYSAQCRSRNRADAEVHAHLHRVAGLARALFEHALERVALHEGLALPAMASPSET